MNFMYLGTLVVGAELVQTAYMGRTARFVTMNQSGNVQVLDAKLGGNLPMRIACLHHLLESMPPGMSAYPVHPGLGGDQFFKDFVNAKEALILETQD